MKGKCDKSKFIEILKEAPFISYAAKKIGIARSTIYRWIKNDYEFNKTVNNALNLGRASLVDVAEMGLVNKIKDKDMGAIKFFLMNNDKRYISKRPIYISPQKRNLNPGESCEICGQEQFPQLSPEEADHKVKEWVKEELINREMRDYAVAHGYVFKEENTPEE